MLLARHRHCRPVAAGARKLALGLGEAVGGHDLARAHADLVPRGNDTIGGGGVGAADIAALSQCHVGACEMRSEEHTSELQSLMRISSAVFCLKKQIDVMYEQSPATAANVLS